MMFGSKIAAIGVASILGAAGAEGMNSQNLKNKKHYPQKFNKKSPNNFDSKKSINVNKFKKPPTKSRKVKHKRGGSRRSRSVRYSSASGQSVVDAAQNYEQKMKATLVKLQTRLAECKANQAIFEQDQDDFEESKGKYEELNSDDFAEALEDLNGRQRNNANEITKLKAAIQKLEDEAQRRKTNKMRNLRDKIKKLQISKVWKTSQQYPLSKQFNKKGYLRTTEAYNKSIQLAYRSNKILNVKQKQKLRNRYVLNHQKPKFRLRTRHIQRKFNVEEYKKTTLQNQRQKFLSKQATLGQKQEEKKAWKKDHEKNQKEILSDPRSVELSKDYYGNLKRVAQTAAKCETKFPGVSRIDY